MPGNGPTRPPRQIVLAFNGLLSNVPFDVEAEV